MAVKRPKHPLRKKGTSWARTLSFWGVLIVVGLVVAAYVAPHNQYQEVALSDVISQANDGKLERIDVQGNDLLVTTKAETEKGNTKPTIKSYKEDGTIYDQGLKLDARVKVNPIAQSQTGATVVGILSILGPVVLLGALFLFMFRQAQGQSNQALGFGKSKARLYGNEKTKVIFSEIAGNDEDRKSVV